MNGNRIVGNVLIAGGALLIVASITADLSGLGEGTAFGWKQITAVVLGLLDIMAGVLINRRQPPTGAPD